MNTVTGKLEKAFALAHKASEDPRYTGATRSVFRAIAHQIWVSVGKPDDGRLRWTMAAIGCYWYACDFSIETYRSGREGRQEFPECGYKLSRSREVIGRYATLETAKAVAERMVRDGE